MMTVPKITGTTGDQIISSVQDKQTTTISSVLNNFLTFDVGFKFGNPSNYNKKLFYSFTPSIIDDPFTWESYKEKTPNALPTAGGSVTLIDSKANYPDAWKALETYVGFSDISSISYSDNGSYITDFFIDLNVAFNENNIKNLYPIIKIYASQKLAQFQTNSTPPTLPATQPYEGALIETYELAPNERGGTKVLIFKQGPRKFAVLVGQNDEPIYVGEKISISANPDSIGIVNEALQAIYGNQASAPEITNIIKTPTPQFPAVPDPVGKWSKSTLSNSLGEFVRNTDEFQNKILDSFFIKIRKKLPDISLKSEVLNESVLEGPQPKVDLWETFKAINDKWIAGNDFKQKTLFEDVLLLDRASRNIGDVVLCDIYKLRNQLMTIDPTNNMLGFVTTILVENNFVVMNIPSYVNFYNVQEAQKNAKPRLDSTSDFANNLFGTFLNVDYRDSSAKMVCFYSGKPSEIVDVKDNVDFRFRDDAFEITKASSNPLAENQIDKTDWDKSNKVVGFSVDIGPQNQSIFYGFNINQGNSQSTAEALQVLNQMANQGGNRAVATQNLSLYNLYKNRSYTCTVSLMGNAMIQPTMYFNLRHVPMFSGPYMITKVTHTVNPGSFETILEAVRQPTASLPKIDNFLQILKTNLLNSIVEESNRQKEAINNEAKKAENIKAQQKQLNDFVSSNPTNSASANQSCTASTNFAEFTYKKAIKETLTTNQMVGKVKSLVGATTITAKDKLNMCVFAAAYIASGTQTGFQANNNNFIGLDLQQDWNKNYMEKTYFCSSSNVPFVSFATSDDSLKYLVERWKDRMYKVEQIDAKTIAKFYIEQFAAQTLNREDIYNSYDPTQLSNLESEVQSAINLFNSSNA